MTKTEQKLIDRARKDRLGRTYVAWGTTWGTTGTGKPHAYGERERVAAKKLVEKGVFKELYRHSSSDVRQGWTTYRGTDVTLELV